LELFCLSENQGLTSFWEWDQGVGEGRGEEKKEGNGGNGGEKATRALQKGRFFFGRICGAKVPFGIWIHGS